MELIKNHEHYISLVKDVNDRFRPVITNCYLSSEIIDKYIRRKSFFYQTIERGILFLADECSYYKAYYYINPEVNEIAVSANKLIVIQTLYKKKDKRLNKIEELFQNAGFKYTCTELQMKVSVSEERALLLEPYKKALKLFDIYKLSLVYPSNAMFDQLRAMQYETPDIAYWRFYYYTDIELETDAKEKKLRCVIDASGNIIGAVHEHADGMGWIAVKREYKLIPGVAIVLRMPPDTYTGYKIGWIQPENKQSMNFHTKVGYKETGVRMDEWIKEYVPMRGK